MITVACVRTGTKYPIEHVEILRNMVARHLPGEYRFVCFTNMDDEIDGVENVHIDRLPRWWGKMALFIPAARGHDQRCLYLDLDTVIVGDLTPFAEYDGPFAICENFTRLAGNTDWPCRYGSCAMSFPAGWGQDLFDTFWKDSVQWMRDCPKGDQEAIEKLHPDAVFLQDVLPDGFFLNKRDLDDHPEGPPPGTAVVTFGGKVQTASSDVPWIKSAWV